MKKNLLTQVIATAMTAVTQAQPGGIGIAFAGRLDPIPKDWVVSNGILKIFEPI